jgi:hypothetical protein
VLLAAYGGLRWGELAGLRRKRINLDAATVTVVEQLLEVRGTFTIGPAKSTAGRRTTRTASSGAPAPGTAEAADRRHDPRVPSNDTPDKPRDTPGSVGHSSEWRASWPGPDPGGFEATRPHAA